MLKIMRNNTLLKVYLLVEVVLDCVRIFSIINGKSLPLSLSGFAITLVTGIAMLVLFLKYGRYLNDGNSIFLFAAMMSVLAGDVFLCLLGDMQAPKILVNLGGYLCFAVCESFFALYFGLSRKNIVCRIALFVVMLALFTALGKLTPERIPIVLSFAILTVNEVVGWMRYRKDRNRMNLLVASGVTGLFVCDYAIMARTLLPANSLPYLIAFVIAWLAYVPFQMLITVAYSRQCHCTETFIDNN